MAVLFAPWGNQQLFDDSGNPATGWKIYTYAANSSTPLASYTTSAGNVAQSNPIIIDSLGFPVVGQIWLTSGLAYKMVLTNALNVVKKTEDNITGVTGTSTVSQWIASGLTPTYLSATSFTLAGDQTSDFHLQRRLQSTTTAGTIYSTITGTAYTTLTTVTVSNDSGVLDSGLSAVNLGFLTALNPSVPASYSRSGANSDITSLSGLTTPLSVAQGGTGGNVQLQSATAFQATGTSGVYVLTPAPAIAAYTANLRFRVAFNVAGGATNTIAVNGLAAKSIKQYDSTGAKVASIIALSQLVDIEYDGVDFVMLSSLPAAVKQIQSISASVAASSLTGTLGVTSLDFRSSTLSSGSINTRAVTSSVSLVVPSGATLGTTSLVSNRLILLAIDNAGIVELAIINLAGGNNLDETLLISTTAINASATSGNTAYSSTARSNVPFRVVGYIENIQTTAGTWVTAPSTVQGMGGQALVAMSSIGYGQSVQNVTASRVLGTTYYNTTGKPIYVIVTMNVVSGDTTMAINGVTVVRLNAPGTSSIQTTVFPGASYSLSVGGTNTISTWFEFR